MSLINPGKSFDDREPVAHVDVRAFSVRIRGGLRSSRCMSDRFYFDLEGPRANAWVWRRVDDHGTVVDQSRRFPYYLAAVRDARAHGFTGTLQFGRPTARRAG
jgi:hypothetical protein